MGWGPIRNGKSTLLLAPTGSGKTLAAFLCALDRLMTEPAADGGVKVLYVSPLKALAVDIDRHVKEDKLADLAKFFETRFPQPSESVDGILCWDVMDFLDRPAAHALAASLTRLLRPDGALLGFFSTAEGRGQFYTKYVVVDDANLRYRTYPAARARQRSLLNRDIIKLFDGLRVTDSFLMKNNVREILFRKPAYLAGR